MSENSEVPHRSLLGRRDCRHVAGSRQVDEKKVPGAEPRARIARTARGLLVLLCLSAVVVAPEPGEGRVWEPGVPAAASVGGARSAGIQDTAQTSERQRTSARGIIRLASSGGTGTPGAASPESGKACEAAAAGPGRGGARSGTVLAALFSLPGWNATQMAGYLASFLVIMTFCMREMWALRCAAVASNVAFITYGYLAVLPPVFLLHTILLPVNVVRAIQLSSRAGMKRRPYRAVAAKHSYH